MDLILCDVLETPPGDTKYAQLGPSNKLKHTIISPDIITIENGLVRKQSSARRLCVSVYVAPL